MAKAIMQQDRNVKTLKRSMLQGYKEFHIMCNDVEHYHQQLKHDVLSGKQPPKRDLDMRPYLYDTGDNYDKSFYGILINMLLEINLYQNKEKQQEDLRRIFSWYQANKHLLSDDKKEESLGLPDALKTSNAARSPGGIRRRPMSSLDNASRTGVLRYTFARKASSPVITNRKRAETANPRLRENKNSCNFGVSAQDDLLVKQGREISSPGSKSSNSLTSSPRTSLRRSHTRPGTAPASLLNDFESLFRKFAEATDGRVGESATQEEEQEPSPVSKVSVHFLDDKESSPKDLKSSPSPELLLEQKKRDEIDIKEDDLVKEVISNDQSITNEISGELSGLNSPADEERSLEARGDQNITPDEGIDEQMSNSSGEEYVIEVRHKSRNVCGIGHEMATPLRKKIVQGRENPSPDPSRKVSIQRTDTADSNGSSQSVSEVKVSLGEMAKPYDVHFAHDFKNDPVRHYRTSGPVEPDSKRYRWRDDGHGGRTFVKKISRQDLLSRDGVTRRNSRKAGSHPCTLLRTSSHKRILDPKSLASMLVVKHLGFVDRRSSDRFIGFGETRPVWIEDSNDYALSSEYIAFTRGLELKYGKKDRNGHKGHADDHVKIKLPYLHYKDKPRTIENTLNNNSDPRYEYETESWPGEMVKLANESDDILRRIIEESKGNLPAMSDEEERRLAAMRATQSTDTSLSEARGKAVRLEPKPPAGSVTYSRMTSGRSRPAPSVEEEPETQKRELSFDVSHFHHFCFEDNPDLDDEYRLQMEVNAAVDIQRIFRGHMARQYMMQLQAAEKERQKKAAIALQSAMRGYLTRKRLMEENIRSREPTVTTYEWAKGYKEELKKKDQERKQKMLAKAKKDNKIKASQEGALKKVTATEKIYDLFHDKTPSKAQMKAAAITIQRYVRGWLVRRFLEKAKTKAMKRTLDFGGFINGYRSHLAKIMQRHGVENAEVVVKFNELLEYIEKRNKYEVEFDRIAKGSKFVAYQDIKGFFEACKLCPSSKEINDAVKAVLSAEDFAKRKEHQFTKAEIVDIAFHVFVPKGTKLKDTRKSTWMNPLLGVDEKTKLALSKKVKQQTDFNLAFRLVSSAKLEREEMAQKAINPELLPEDAKREGFVNITAATLKDASKLRPGKEHSKLGKPNGRPSSGRRKPVKTK